ncbi:hypothetical protein AC578_1173 [Pseudocercospora eumusae]|uniref:Uncharacterized protein n=1 Tax=Pseudocercospora eumusae TaxID=321146 RepID=A0A139HJU3_9PEZI|nr:hypothetical protein AC578_1173 [Pseudocercospora eumusae]
MHYRISILMNSPRNGVCNIPCSTSATSLRVHTRLSHSSGAPPQNDRFSSLLHLQGTTNVIHLHRWLIETRRGLSFSLSLSSFSIKTTEKRKMKMQFFTTTLFLFLSTTTITTISATPIPIPIPIPASMNEIEKRWAAGDSEQQIHPGLSHRDMTPAWPVVRQKSGGFASATDERSLEVAEEGEKKKREIGGWMARGFWRRRRRSDDEAEDFDVVVLRPRKAMKYYFTAATSGS